MNINSCRIPFERERKDSTPHWSLTRRILSERRRHALAQGDEIMFSGPRSTRHLRRAGTKSGWLFALRR